MKKKLTTEEITERIMKCEKEMGPLKYEDLSIFSQKYLDLLELKELEYNISNYAS